jgi:hypothetical protein
VDDGLCGELVSVLPLGLEWSTEIFLRNIEFRDLIFNVTKTSGFQIECDSFGTIVKDQCTGTTSGALQNTVTGVELIFESLTEKLNCTEGGASSGDVEQKVEFKVAGKTLTVS